MRLVACPHSLDTLTCGLVAFGEISIFRAGRYHARF